MGKARHFFLKIDQFIFNKLDQLKSDSSFQKVNDLLLNLNDEQQKIFIQVLVFSLIIVPYFVLAGFWWSNSAIRNRLELKSQIIDQISLFNGNKDALSNLSNRYLSTNGISNKEEFENKIVNIASKYNINPNKVQMIEFVPISTTSTVSKSEAKLRFSDFGTIDFSNFMREIVETERFKILKVDLTKNLDNSLLQGTIEIRHIGRTVQVGQ